MGKNGVMVCGHHLIGYLLHWAVLLLIRKLLSGFQELKYIEQCPPSADATYMSVK